MDLSCGCKLEDHSLDATKGLLSYRPAFLATLLEWLRDTSGPTRNAKCMSQDIRCKATDTQAKVGVSVLN